MKRDSVEQPSVRKSNAQQRTSPRADVNKRAVLVMPRSGQPLPVLLRNISKGGACVQTDARLSVGDDIRLLVDAEPKVKLILEAIVLDIRPTRGGLYREYGLKFLNSNKAVADALVAFVDRGIRARPKASTG